MKNKVVQVTISKVEQGLSWYELHDRAIINFDKKSIVIDLSLPEGEQFKLYNKTITNSAVFNSATSNLIEHSCQNGVVDLIIKRFNSIRDAKFNKTKLFVDAISMTEFITTGHFSVVQITKGRTSVATEFVLPILLGSGGAYLIRSLIAGLLSGGSLSTIIGTINFFNKTVSDESQIKINIPTGDRRTKKFKDDLEKELNRVSSCMSGGFINRFVQCITPSAWVDCIVRNIADRNENYIKLLKLSTDHFIEVGKTDVDIIEEYFNSRDDDELK